MGVFIKSPPEVRGKQPGEALEALRNYMVEMQEQIEFSFSSMKKTVDASVQKKTEGGN